MSFMFRDYSNNTSEHEIETYLAISYTPNLFHTGPERK